MNENQIKWVKGKIAYMEQQIVSNAPINDSQWKQIAAFIADTVSKAKGCEVETRKMLHDAIEPYDRKANNEMRCFNAKL